jgi:hypothetical protein
MPFANKILEGAKSIPGTEGDEIEGSKNKLSLSKVIKNLDKLSLIVKHLTPAEDNATDHVMVQVLKDMWGLLETFLLRFYVRTRLKQDMQTVVESICKFIKLIMRCIKHLFGQFVEPYFKIIVQNYEVQ